MPHHPQHTGSSDPGSVPVEPARARRDPLGIGGKWRNLISGSAPHHRWNTEQRTGSAPVEPTPLPQDPLGLGSTESRLPPWAKAAAQHVGRKTLKRPATHHSCARWGNLVPDAYIDRVFLEEALVARPTRTWSGPNSGQILEGAPILQTPKITVNIKLIDRLSENGTYSLLGDVLNQQQQNSSTAIDLREYFEVRCMITTSPDSTAELETILQQSPTVLPGNTPTRTGKSTTLLDALQPSPGASQNWQQTLQSETYTNSDGNEEIIISYTFQPITNNAIIDHLSVFTFVQLNTDALSAALNLQLPPSVEWMMGSVEQELVIENSQVVSLLKGTAPSGTTTEDERHAHQYSLDSNGNGETEYAIHPQEPQIRHKHQVINGIVQNAQSDCWRVDPLDPESCQQLYKQGMFVGPAGAGPHIHQLAATWIPINNVQDFRIRDEIESLLAEFMSLLTDQTKFPVRDTSPGMSTFISTPKTFQEETEDCWGAITPHPQWGRMKEVLTEIAAKDSYLSEMFITKDADRNSRFFFAFDHGKYCLENSKYAHIISGLSDTGKQAIINVSPITQLRIRKRQVREEPAVNSLGAPVRDYLLNNGHSTIENPVIISLGDPNLTEINLILEDQPSVPGSSLRYFTGLDKNIDFTPVPVGSVNPSVTANQTKKSDGFYQYSIEATTMDGFVTIMQYLALSLRNMIADYQQYIALTEVPGVYDEQSRKFTTTPRSGIRSSRPDTAYASGIPSMRAETSSLSGQQILQTWAGTGNRLEGIVGAYILILGTFIDLTKILQPGGITKADYYTDKILTLIAPETGTVEGILLFGNLISLLLTQINNTIKVGHSGGGVEDTLGDPPSNRDSLFKPQTMELKEYFVNTIGARFINESFVDNIGSMPDPGNAISGLSVYTRTQLASAQQIEVNLDTDSNLNRTPIEMLGNLGITYDIIPVTQGTTSAPSYTSARDFLGPGSYEALTDILGPKDLAEEKLPDLPAEVYQEIVQRAIASDRETTSDNLQQEVDVLTGFVLQDTRTSNIESRPMMRMARFEKKTLGQLVGPGDYYLCRQTRRSDVEVINSYFLVKYYAAAPGDAAATTGAEPEEGDPSGGRGFVPGAPGIGMPELLWVITGTGTRTTPKVTLPKGAWSTQATAPFNILSPLLPGTWKPPYIAGAWNDGFPSDCPPEQGTYVTLPPGQLISPFRASAQAGDAGGYQGATMWGGY